ncbi:Palmitoyl-monogalactosyldiacylglycerol delta-7 desaturase, chloroplastic [Sesamum angolense]|uniref:Palmitoyl-monogalactosyldiacylglycerol delta-7 desaturase, chloroplastic n=1 Tax=Sesamum angolense TaxID=2727404 RepID=A0AAE1WL04_9LAMI|nr:Palmitoyl-monogalactosyldiacylglycerol delta-7 desaturase, chloroplastic [Sesamum angolense]
MRLTGKVEFFGCGHGWGGCCYAFTMCFCSFHIQLVPAFFVAVEVFKLPKWLEYLFAYCGVQALQWFSPGYERLHVCGNRVYTSLWLELAVPFWNHASKTLVIYLRNNWWVAMLAFGEGWHNNHHAFEYSARHGLEWWQIDMTWYVVRLLQAIGLATDVKLPTTAQKQRMSFSS